MNERIRELTESCIIEEYNQHGNLIEDGFDYGKFAELIIKECAEFTHSVTRKFIMQHFGIEE